MHSLRPANNSSLLQQITDLPPRLRMGGSQVMDHLTFPEGQGKINVEHYRFICVAFLSAPWLWASALLTDETISPCFWGPMMFLPAEIQGVPSSAWGSDMRPLLLLALLWCTQVSGWASAFFLGSSAFLTVNCYGGQESSFVVGEISVQILALPILSKWAWTKVFNLSEPHL